MHTSRPTILLLGGSGQLGWELRRTLVGLGSIMAPTREELDLSQTDALSERLRAIDAALVVNAAAWTDVDGAEADPALAFRLNAEVPSVLARAAADAGTLLVQFSTDYVFDGAAAVPYRETDEPSPLNVYGASKLAGERAIRDAGGPHLILRTSWLYGQRGHNFVRTVLRLAREREELTIVEDQIGCPTWSRTVAEATAGALARLATGVRFELPTHDAGVYHLCADGRASWYAFANEIIARDPLRHEQLCRAVRPVATSAFERPAQRPPFSVLDCTRFLEVFNIRLPRWGDQLALALEEARWHDTL